MINHEYLEKYCTDEINRIGKLERENPTIQKTHSTIKNEGRMEAFAEILAIIAQEVAYEREQV